MVSPPPDVGSRAGAAAPTPSTSSPSGAGRGAALPDAPVAVDRADIRPLDLSGALQILIAEVRAALVEVLAADLSISPGEIANPDNPIVASDLLAGGNTPAGNAELLTAVAAQDAALAGAPRNVANLVEGNDFPPSNGAAVGNAEGFAAGGAQAFDGPVQAARAIVDLALRSLPEAFEPGAWSLALPRVDLALQSGVHSAIDVVSVWRDVPPAVVEATQESASLALALLADEPIYPWPPPEWLGMAPGLRRLWRRRRFLKRQLADPDYGINSSWDDLNEPGR